MYHKWHGARPISYVFRFITFFLAFLATPAASAQPISVGGSGSTTAVAKLLADAYNKKYPQEPVSVSPALGTPGGIKALGAKAVAVALASRPLNEKEVASGLRAVEFARTPLVMAVAATNPLNGIAFAHLAKLYAAPDAIWPDGSRVRVVLRPPDDVDTRIVIGFSADVAKGVDAALARPGAYVAATDEDAINAIQRLPGAIGQTTLAQILADKRPLKALMLEGRQPSAEAIRDGKYPWYKRHFLITSGDVAGSAKRFVEFARSEEAMRLLAAHGCWVGDYKGR